MMYKTFILLMGTISFLVFIGLTIYLWLMFLGVVSDINHELVFELNMASGLWTIFVVNSIR